MFCVVPFSSYLTLNNHDLEKVIEVVPFESLGAVACSPAIVTMAASLTVYEIFSIKV